MYTIIFGVVLVIVLYLILTTKSPEQLCVTKKYGIVTDIPASNYVNANMALVNSTSLGQAPFGDPRYWIPNRSPITQGMYGLYQGNDSLAASQPFDRSSLDAAAKALPVYTEKPLPSQCTQL